MQVLLDRPVRPVFSRSNRPGIRPVAARTAASLGGGGALIFVFLPGGSPVKYTDPDGRTDEIPFWDLYSKILGSIAHTYIESGLVSQFEGKGEYPVPGAGKKGYPGRVDYMREIGPNREFYEIKPITQQDENFGQVQLQNYISHAIKNGDSSAVAGTSILGDIQGMRINNVPFDLPVGDGNMSHVLGDIRMITFPGDAARKGMIYYEISNMRPNAEAYRQQFKTTLIVGGVVAGVLGLGGMLGPLPALIPALAH